MSEQKYYYKVCRVNEITGQLVSYSDIIEPKRTITYKVGEYVYTKRPGHLLVLFEDLESAQRFMLYWCDKQSHKLFKCEVEGVCKEPMFLLDGTYSGVKHKGQTFAYGIKLIEEVCEEENEFYKNKDVVEIEWSAMGKVKYIILKILQEYEEKYVLLDTVLFTPAFETTLWESQLNRKGIKLYSSNVMSIKKVGHVDKISYDETL